MMRPLLLCFTLAVVTALTACGKTDQEKAQDAADDGNNHIAAGQSEVDYLRSNYGIYISDFDHGRHHAPSGMRPAELHDAETHLNSLITHNNDAIIDSQTDGVVLLGEDAIRNEINDAQDWVAAIDARLAGLDGARSSQD